jgi:hypothetical protein
MRPVTFLRIRVPAGLNPRRKLLALFDRAAARDFADVRLLARRFGKDVLLARAAQIDAGFDTATLASMIATLDRFADD